jgi:hypothetical protein
MLVSALFGGMSLGLVATGVAALYEQQLYTPEQRENARHLFRIRGFVWVLTTGLGVFGFWLAITGESAIVIDFTLPFALLGPVLAFTERRLHRALEVDRSPLTRRFDEWWSHPSER